MTIPSVIQGLVETEGGKVFELDSPKGAKWLESVNSFRYEPTGGNKPYTVRQETKKGGDYWYAYRKVKGLLHKRYIGATSSLSVPKLEEIAEALNTPQQSRVTEIVTDTVTYKPADDELTALKVQVQALQKSLEALRNEVLGKLQMGDAFESPELVTEVTDDGLLTELGNLKTESEALRQELAEVRAENQEWRNAFARKDQTVIQAKEAADFEYKVWEREFTEMESERDDLGQTLTETKQQYSSLLASLNQELASLRSQLETLKAENESLRTAQPVAEFELPEAPELLNKLKAKRKKATASLADIEAILGILEELTPDEGN
jgi:chromosome segregation ATPase